jgi:hypothetical protein
LIFDAIVCERVLLSFYCQSLFEQLFRFVNAHAHAHIVTS